MRLATMTALAMLSLAGCAGSSGGHAPPLAYSDPFAPAEAVLPGFRNPYVNPWAPQPAMRTFITPGSNQWGVGPASEFVTCMEFRNGTVSCN